MRDPARIDKALNLLKAYWHTYPDLRLAQIISNFYDQYQSDNLLPQSRDVFHFEDSDIIKLLEEKTRTGRP